MRNDKKKFKNWHLTKFRMLLQYILGRHQTKTKWKLFPGSRFYMKQKWSSTKGIGWSHPVTILNCCESMHLEKSDLPRKVTDIGKGISTSDFGSLEDTIKDAKRNLMFHHSKNRAGAGKDYDEPLPAYPFIPTLYVVPNIFSVLLSYFIKVIIV